MGGFQRDTEPVANAPTAKISTAVQRPDGLRSTIRSMTCAEGASRLAPEAAAPPVQMRAVFRGMKEAGGKPAIEETARGLGVRPGTDATIVDGTIKADGKGMSTSPDDPKNLPRHRRPQEWGGTGPDPVWETTDAALTNKKLAWVNDAPTHGTVSSPKDQPYADYKSALEATQSSWKKRSPDSSSK